MTEEGGVMRRGHEPRMQVACSSWKRPGSGFAPGASRREAALWTHYTLLVSRTARE